MTKQPLVLLVARDDVTRREVANGLGMYGHDVLTAAGGQEAVELIAAHRQRIGVLVTDAEIGGEVDGLAVAKAARGLDPKIGVIYTARIPHAIPASRQVSGAPLVRAPYHPHQLAGVIAMLRHEAAADRSSQLEHA